MESPNDPSPVAEPKPFRRMCCGFVAVLLILVGSCSTLILYKSVGYRIRSNVANFGIRLTLAVDNGEVHASATRRVLIRRLRREGILAKVTLGTPGKLLVDIHTADREVAVPLLLADAELRFMVVVDDLDATTHSAEVARIRSEQAAGTWHVSNDRYALYPWHSGSLGAGGEPVLMSTENMLSGDDFEDSYRALDGNGRGALGFTMSPVAA
jgi:hypothetical protein